MLDHKQIADTSTAINDSAAKPNWFGEPDRRRGLWTFLTWAFFLSEAFKSVEAEAAAAKPGDDLAPHVPDMSGAEGTPQSLDPDSFSYNEWPIALPADTEGLFPLPGRMPIAAGESTIDDLGMSRAGRTDGPFFEGGGVRGSAAATGDATPADTTTAAVSDSPADAGLHLDLGGDGLGLGSTLSSLGDTLNDVLGSPVLVLGELTETALSTVSDLTTVVSSTVNTVTSGLLGGALGSSGLLNILGGGSQDGNDLFSGGKYTDYHLALQTSDTTGPLSVGQGVVEAGMDLVGDLAGGLIPAIGHSGSPGHEAGASSIGLPSAVDELLLRGHVDLVM